MAIGVCVCVLVLLLVLVLYVHVSHSVFSQEGNLLQLFVFFWVCGQINAWKMLILLETISGNHKGTYQAKLLVEVAVMQAQSKLLVNIT